MDRDKGFSNRDNLLKLELRQLQVLQAIAANRSFWRASEALECAPSAVSQQLASLEAAVGHRLFNRTRGGRTVELTEPGAVLLRHAEAVIARLRAARADLAALDEGEGSRLRLGIYQSVGAKIVPPALVEFQRDWPGVEVAMAEAETDAELLELLERGELDLTFTTLPLPPGPFASSTVLEDPYVLVVPSDSDVALRSVVKLADLAACELIGIRTCRTQVENHLRGVGLDPQVRFHSADNQVVQGLVGAGYGAAIAPRLTMDDRDDKIRLLPLETFPARVLGLAWHRDRYRLRVSMAFEATVKRVCSEVQQRNLGADTLPPS